MDRDARADETGLAAATPGRVSMTVVRSIGATLPPPADRRTIIHPGPTRAITRAG